MIKADLHIHSCFSGDSDNKPDAIVKACLAKDLKCAAICDHGTIDGSLAVKELAPFKVIVAEEILTPVGEIIGMFLTSTIPGGLTVEETIFRIREQNGIVCIPHPFDIYRSSGMQSETLEKIIDHIDIVEVFNARTIPIQNTRQPRQFALKHALLMGAGSDAHTTEEIGRAYVTIPDFTGRDEFLEAMRHAHIHGASANPFLVIKDLPARIIRKTLRKRG